jgi:hypothetical protein
MYMYMLCRYILCIYSYCAYIYIMYIYNVIIYYSIVVECCSFPIVLGLLSRVDCLLVKPPGSL